MKRTTLPLKTFRGVKEPINVSFKGSPDMLMYNLRVNVSSVSEQLRQEMKRYPKSASALIGVSGCGKTRSMFEILAQEYGYYFVCHTKNNGGSRDMQVAMAWFVGHSQHLQALKVSRALLCSREYIFKETNILVPDLTPEVWLAMQLYPTEYFGTDIFVDVLEHFLHDGSYDDTVSPNCSLVFIDEAQVLSDYAIADNGRKLLSIVLETACYKYSSVIAGTGFAMQASLDILGSDSLKLHTQHQPYGVRNRVFCSFDLTKTEDNVKQYLGLFFQNVPLVEGRDLAVLRGRKRILAVFCKKVIERMENDDMLPDVAAKAAVDDLRKWALSEEEGSFSTVVKKVMNTKLRESMLRLAVAACLDTFVHLDPEEYGLVESSICALEKTTTGGGISFKGRICEPLLLQSIFSNHFETAWSRLFYLSTDMFEDSSFGFYAELFSFPYVLTFLKENLGSLTRDAPVECSWVKQSKLKTSESEIPFKVLSSSPNFMFSDFIKSELVAFLPDKLHHADTVVKLRNPDGPDRVSFWQYKVYAEHTQWVHRDGSDSEILQHAIKTTSLEGMYRVGADKNGNSLSKDLENMSRNALQTHVCHGGILRCIILFPDYSGPPVRYEKETGDVILFVSLAKIIPKDWANVLSEMKKQLTICSCKILKDGKIQCFNRCGCSKTEHGCSNRCHKGLPCVQAEQTELDSKRTRI